MVSLWETCLWASLGGNVVTTINHSLLDLVQDRESFKLNV
jgi:hypothetical protein